MTGYQSGLLGEKLAAEYLVKQGLSILQTRFKSRHGEIDIIARDKDTLCFIEVKYRPNGRLGCGLESVTLEKRRRMKNAVQAYLSLQPSAYRVGCLEITRAGVLYYPDILHES